MHVRNKIPIILTAFFALLVWGLASKFVDSGGALSIRLLFGAFVCGLCGFATSRRSRQDPAEWRW